MKIILIGLILCLKFNVGLAAENLTSAAARSKFMQNMQLKHHFSLEELNKILHNYTPNEEVLSKISNPAEKLCWGRYKKLLVSNERIAKGKNFLIKYNEILIQAEQTYGVPKELIAAILGIESFYGERAGNIPVISALATLSFDYPPRAKFFEQELEAFLLLTREYKLDPMTIKGSYAGAMSPAQFIPTSYKNYAVDFGNIGSKDLNHMANAIGSIANYLSKHGWKKQGSVAKKLEKTQLGKNYADYLEKDLSSPKPKFNIKQLQLQLKWDDATSLANPATLLEFSLDLDSKHKEYWLGFHNFYVITRYNHSSNYAMAVYQLALSLGMLS